MQVFFKNNFLLLFSCSVVSDSLRSHRLQQVRFPCLSPSPRVCSNSCPLSHCCHPTILSSVTPFSSCPESFSTSGSFPMTWLFPSRGQSIGVSASSNEYSGLISLKTNWFDLLAVQMTLKSNSPATQFKIINSLELSCLYGPILTTTGKTSQISMLDTLNFHNVICQLHLNKAFKKYLKDQTCKHLLQITAILFS